jgi:acetolactate synthase-1/2/3 large subunit
MIEVMHALNEWCPPDAIHFVDMGEYTGIALHYLAVGPEGDFCAAFGFGSMGSGIVSAIGYQLGAPDRRTYSICGDGAMLMYGTELATAVQWRLPTTFLVMNDSRLNMVWHGMRELYGRSQSFDTQEIDFAAWARAMGAEGEIVRTVPELAAGLRTRPAGSPRLLDVRIDPDIRLNDSQRTAALRQLVGNGSEA